MTPTRVEWEHGHVYVGGHDHDRDAARWFRLDRMADVRIVDAAEDVEAPHEVELGPITYVPRGDEVELVLRCTHVGSWVLQRTTPTHRLDLDDGWIWAVVHTDTPDTVEDHIIVAGGEAEVVTPADRRSSIEDRARLLH